jgi:hypothetical protein
MAVYVYTAEANRAVDANRGEVENERSVGKKANPDV